MLHCGTFRVANTYVCCYRLELAKAVELKVMSHLKKAAASKARQIRREPTPADYCDDVSDKALDQLRKVAASKDKRDEHWELIDGPAW